MVCLIHLKIINDKILTLIPFFQADIFSYGIFLCQFIALVSNDPEELPRSDDFGLAQDLFQKLISVPPAPGSSPSTSLPPPENYLQLAYDCCQVIAALKFPPRDLFTLSH